MATVGTAAYVRSHLLLNENYISCWDGVKQHTGDLSASGANIAIGIQSTNIIDGNESFVVSGYAGSSGQYVSWATIGPLKTFLQGQPVECSMDTLPVSFVSGQAQIEVFDGSTTLASGQISSNFGRTQFLFNASASTSNYQVRIKSLTNSTWVLVTDNVYLGRPSAAGGTGSAGNTIDLSSVKNRIDTLSGIVNTNQSLDTTAINGLSGTVSTNQALDTTAISTLSGNLITSGQTLIAQRNLDTTAINTLSGIVSTNQTFDTTAINTLSGNLISSGQTLIAQRNLDTTAINTLSGIVSTNQTLDTTAITTLSGIVTTNQSLDTTAINTLSGIVTTNQTIDLAALATLSGNLIASGQTLLANDTGTGGGSSVNSGVMFRNYVLNGNFETQNDWSLFNISGYVSGTVPTTTAPTIGSASSISLTLSTANKLSDNYSLAVSASSTSGFIAGQGIISPVYSLQTRDQAKILGFNFVYQALSGATTMAFNGNNTGTWGVYFWDNTNSGWIQPAGVYNLVQSQGVGIATGSFQTPSNMTSFRMALLAVEKTSGSATLLLDDVSVSPQILATGAAITDSVLDSTISFSASFGTVTNQAIYTSRRGDKLLLQGSFKTGTETGSTGYIQLGSYAIDYSKIPNASAGQIVGWAAGTSSATTGLITVPQSAFVFVDGSTTNQLFFAYQSTSSALAKVNANAIFNGTQTITFYAEIPVTGWSSNTVVSSDTDTRVVAAFAYASASTQSVSSNAAINFDSILYDTHSVITTGGSGTWKYTAPISGFYEIAVSINDGTGNNAKLYKNGVASYYFKGGTTGLGGGTLQVKLNAGDYVSVNCGGSTTVNGASDGNGTHISIKRLSGPAVIAQSETVAASYYVSTNYSVTANQAINFDTKLYDSHAAVTTGSSNSWKFTAPVVGYYLITLVYSTSGSGSSVLYKNGSSYRKFVTPPGAGACGASATIQLNAGDYISINSDATETVTGSSAPYVSSVEIARLK